MRFFLFRKWLAKLIFPEVFQDRLFWKEGCTGEWKDYIGYETLAKMKDEFDD